MIQKELNLTLKVDTPGNTLAIAVGGTSPGQNFIAANRIFSTVFPDIPNPRQLLEFTESEGEDKTILKYNESTWELLTLKINRDTLFYLLKNISYEKLVLARIKKQLKELTDTHTFYAEILEKELPVGVLIINDNYDVSYANHTLKRFFRIPARVRLQKCYNYVKEIKPCQDCVLKGIQKDKRKNKKTFTVEGDNRLVTAEIHLVGDKYIIIFRDTTKEIKLIKEIKKQQAELESANKMIADQNNILRRLSTINIRIGQMRDLEAILETMIHAIIETFSCEKGAILLFNETGKIKNAHFTEKVHEAEQDIIIKNIDASIEKTARDSEKNLENIPGKMDIAAEETGKNPAAYKIQDMFHKKKLIGRIFLHQPGKVIDRSVLELFLNQVSVYLENLELQRKLEEVAQTDALTGVFNRYYFEKQFREERELSQRFGQPLSLILIDLNGLKAINDSDGHEAGDQSLRETARFLREHVSFFDTIYRVGGDEFIILLSNCPANHLQIMVEMLKEVQSIASFQYNEKNLPISFCLGGACSTEIEHRQLKDEADRRMYLDKEKYYKMHKKYR
jgi:diguanylate cyclase (GGDEF)-like protein